MDRPYPRRQIIFWPRDRDHLKNEKPYIYNFSNTYENQTLQVGDLRMGTPPTKPPVLLTTWTHSKRKKLICALPWHRLLPNLSRWLDPTNHHWSFTNKHLLHYCTNDLLDNISYENRYHFFKNVIKCFCGDNKICNHCVATTLL